MLHFLVRAVQMVAVSGTLSSLGYYMLCLWSAVVFLREKRTSEDVPPPQEVPPVSILKPLKGTDPEMYGSFRSHCLQRYPEYEIIFGVSDPEDPAAELVARLKTEFPQHAIRLVVCRENLGTNTKVSNLAQMLPEARYEYLIVNDSDIRVEPDYLQRVVAPLADPRTGMVTCLYRGVPGPTLGSQLESIGISTDFSGGVLAARQIEGGIRFGLGSTLAFRRRDLDAVGGFEAFVDYLADDYEIGSRLAAQGLEGKLSDVVVDTFLPAYSLSEFVDHQLRWARTLRDARPWGYLGLALTFSLFWAVLTLISVRGAAWAWELFGLTLCVRLVAALVIGKNVLRDRQVVRWLWLVPLRDWVAVLVWLVSFIGHTVTWRGDRFLLTDGKLARMDGSRSV